MNTEWTHHENTIIQKWEIILSYLTHAKTQLHSKIIKTNYHLLSQCYWSHKEPKIHACCFQLWVCHLWKTIRTGKKRIKSEWDLESGERVFELIVLINGLSNEAISYTLIQYKFDPENYNEHCGICISANVEILRLTCIQNLLWNITQTVQHGWAHRLLASKEDLSSISSLVMII